MLRDMRVLVRAFGTCALLLPTAGVARQGPSPDPVRPASVSAISDALRVEQAKHYDLRATSNGARMMAAVLLRLARAEHARDSLASPFVVSAEAFEAAFVEVTGTPRDSLPIDVRVSTEHHEDIEVEFRQSHVIDAVLDGPRPVFALRVRGGWADSAPRRYTYEDRSGTPILRISHERTTSYVILDYGDMVVHDQVRGVSGRATTGLLAVLFDVIGDARAVESRFALATDGTQVARVSVRKGPGSITQTVTVRPDGVVEKGIPGGRADLRALEQRLSRKLKLRYAQR